MQIGVGEGLRNTQEAFTPILKKLKTIRSLKELVIKKDTSMTQMIQT